ncbi:hypothetical protein pb186bvf_014834 [Paramecium bursaria]
MNLSKEELNQFKIAFQILDTNKDGILSEKQSSTLFLSLGYNISENDIKIMAEDQRINYDTAMEILERHLSVKELIKSFQEYDKQGRVSISDFQNILEDKVDELSDNEKSDILKEADDGDGYVEYKKLFSS